MYEGGLLATLSRAERMWSFYRRESRGFARWLKGGELRVVGETRLWASLIAVAVAEGADEMLICWRELRGLVEIEGREDFWEAGPEVAFREGLKEAQAGAADADDARERLDHYARFSGFSRYEKYLSCGGEVRLMRGFRADFLGPYLRVLRENLRRPRRLRILCDEGTFRARGEFCTVSVVERACGVTVGTEGVGMRFEYS